MRHITIQTTTASFRREAGRPKTRMLAETVTITAGQGAVWVPPREWRFRPMMWTWMTSRTRQPNATPPRNNHLPATAAFVGGHRRYGSRT